MPKYIRADQAGKGQVPKPVTIVCVTDQLCCDTHIRAGRVLADLTDTELVVVHIGIEMGAGDAQTVEYLYSVARQNGAMMQVLYDENPAKALIKFIKHTKVRNLITGMPVSADAVPVQLWCKFTHISFFTVDQSGNLSAVAAPRRSASSLTKEAALSHR